MDRGRAPNGIGHLMILKFIHAKFYTNMIAIYNASKMNTHEFNSTPEGWAV